MKSEINGFLPPRYRCVASKIKLGFTEATKMNELRGIRSSKNQLVEQVSAIKLGSDLIKSIDSSVVDVVDVNTKAIDAEREIIKDAEKKREIFEKNQVLAITLKQDKIRILESCKTDLSKAKKTHPKVNFLNIPKFNIDDDEISSNQDGVVGKIKPEYEKILKQKSILNNENNTFLEIEKNAYILAAKFKSNGDLKSDREPKPIRKFSFSNDKLPIKSRDGLDSLGLLDILKALFPESPFFEINPGVFTSNKIVFAIDANRLDEQIKLKITRYSGTLKGVVDEDIEGTIKEVLRQINSGKVIKLVDLNVKDLGETFDSQANIKKIKEVIDYVEEKNVENTQALESFKEKEDEINLLIATKGKELTTLETSLKEKAIDLSKKISSSLDSLKNFQRTIEKFKSTDEEFVKEVSEGIVRDYIDYTVDKDLAADKIVSFLSTDANKDSLLDKIKEIGEKLKTIIDQKVSKDSKEIDELSSKEIRTKQVLRSRLIRAAKKEFAKKELAKKDDYRNSEAKPSASLNEIRRILDRIRLILSPHRV